MGRQRELTLVEHEEIMKFVASGDPDAAEHAMVKHLERSADLFVHQSSTNA